MHIAYVVRAFDCFSTYFIGGSHRVPRLGATSRKPHCHGVCIVITAICFPATALSVVGCSTELAATDDQGVLEEITLFQILDQCSNRLVNSFDQ